MESTADFSPLAAQYTYTEKQQKLLAAFDNLLAAHSINLEINPKTHNLVSPVAVDIEHDEQGNIVCIGAYDGKSSHCWNTPNVGSWIQEYRLIFHNGVGDIEALKSWGIDLDLAQFGHDTMLIGHLLDSSLKSYGLKDMAKRELSIEYPSYEEIVGKHKGKTKKAPACNQKQSDCCGRLTLDKQPFELVAKYNAMDCYCTYKLYELQRKANRNVSI